jgi:hypothetical protein
MEECKHKNLFKRMSYPKIKYNDELDSLDIKNPQIETFCADCGKYLKSVKVIFSFKPN